MDGQIDSTSRDQEILLSLLEAMPVPTVALDTEGRILGKNARAVDLLGPERAGMHYITAFRQPALLDAIELCAADGTKRQARYISRSGQRDITWRVHIAPHEHGCAMLLSFEDVSPLEQAEQMRRDFVANVSHELRTPLTALLGFIETLRGAARDDPAARERFLEIMADEAGRMSRLVKDLLSLSRVEESERMRPMEHVDLGALICETCTTLRGVADQAGVTLDCDLEPGDCGLNGDAEQLRQVLRNLVENAIKYGQSGGKVFITLRRLRNDPALRGPGLALSVSDEGEGIAPHHIARLTERFYRVDNHRSREIGGTGLGLAIVKHIVNRHRGRLRITSTLGEGSTFTVLLPLG